MSNTGLAVFDKTLQTTNTWLDEIMATVGPDRQVAWHVLGVVLRALRDRVPPQLAAHLGAELPLVVRGAYYDQYRPDSAPNRVRDEEEFLAEISEGLSDIRPVNPRDAVISVLGVLSGHLPRGQCEKVRDALPDALKSLWPLDHDGAVSREDRADTGRRAESAQRARAAARRGADGRSPPQSAQPQRRV
jgi:uncharacterized protein (DUF2267 family)